MNESRPTVDPLGVYTVKRTCAELGICYKTLRKYRMNGYIQPITPASPFWTAGLNSACYDQ